MDIESEFVRGDVIADPCSMKDGKKRPDKLSVMQQDQMLPIKTGAEPLAEAHPTAGLILLAVQILPRDVRRIVDILCTITAGRALMNPERHRIPLHLRRTRIEIGAAECVRAGQDPIPVCFSAYRTCVVSGHGCGQINRLLFECVQARTMRCRKIIACGTAVLHFRL